MTNALQDNPELAAAKDVNSDGRTPLHHAASVGSLGVTQVLLSLSANARELLETKDGMGFTPLIVAVSAGKLDVVRELVGNGADVKASNNRGQTSLHYAASKGA